MKCASFGIAGFLILAWQGAAAQEAATDLPFDAASQPPGWYIDTLRSLGEPDLYDRRNVDTYRVVVFGGSTAPRSIRIDYAGDDFVSTVSAVRADGGREPVRAFQLDPRIREYLTLSIDDAGFWDWPTADPSPPRISSGYTVVFEAVRDRRYHAVIRVNPEPISDFDMAYRSLFSIHRIPVPRDATAKPGPRHAEWHARIILSMEEPDFAAPGRGGDAAFRLTVLNRSESPLAIRFQRTGDDYRIIVRRSSGKGWRADRARLVALADEVGQGTDAAVEIYRRTGVLLETRTLAGDADDWDRLQSLLAEAEFWSRHQPGQIVRQGDPMWVFEGADDGRHQILERPIDDPGSPYAAIADLLLELAGEAQ